MARYSEAMEYLGERIRTLLGPDPRITEKLMFGGLTFLLDGKILVGCRPGGDILLSVGRDFHDEALARPGASPMTQAGRVMTGFIALEPDAFEDDDDLAGWVEFARRAVAARPAAKKSAKPARRR
jgi:TfoX/Sxy family transcriptional regulator of competence genes